MHWLSSTFIRKNIPYIGIPFVDSPVYISDEFDCLRHKVTFYDTLLCLYVLFYQYHFCTVGWAISFVFAREVQINYNNNTNLSLIYYQRCFRSNLCQFVSLTTITRLSTTLKNFFIIQRWFPVKCCRMDVFAPWMVITIEEDPGEAVKILYSYMSIRLLGDLISRRY